MFIECQICKGTVSRMRFSSEQIVPTHFEEDIYSSGLYIYVLYLCKEPGENACLQDLPLCPGI